MLLASLMAPLSLFLTAAGETGRMRPSAAVLALSALLAASCSGSSAPESQPPTSPGPAVSASASPSAPPAALNWPTYHGTSDRAGAAPRALRGPLHQAWS